MLCWHENCCGSSVGGVLRAITLQPMSEKKNRKQKSTRNRRHSRSWFNDLSLPNTQPAIADREHPMPTLMPYAVVFIASACGLVIEIVAGRILAPLVGVSLYTWTSIIGVILAGMSLGNYLGGHLADRFPSRVALGLVLMAGGMCSLGVLFLVTPVSQIFTGLGLLPRIIFLTTTLFFVPSLIIAMVTPLVAKLRLEDLEQAGKEVGKVYAISTSGAIFGTFITGFVLIQSLGTRSTLLLVSIVLVLASLATGGLQKPRTVTTISLLMVVSLATAGLLMGTVQSDCLRESSYYCIQVKEEDEEGLPLKALYLDKLLQNRMSKDDPTLLADGYIKVLAEISHYVAVRNPSLQALFIGGGGYTLPRYLEATYPQSTLEVAEVDPEVTRVASDYLGLGPDTRIVTYNEDARMLAPRLPSGRYDLVLGDAFNDLSVPYHLATLEFAQTIDRLLSPQGIYATNVVDALHAGSFLRSYVHTLQQVFPYVYVLNHDSSWDEIARDTYVVAASHQPLSTSAFDHALRQTEHPESATRFMSTRLQETWLEAREHYLLTDDFAPVDNLLASVFEQRHRSNQAMTAYKAAVALDRQGLTETAIEKYSEAIRLAPHFVHAYNDRGVAHGSLQAFGKAVRDFDSALELNPERARTYNNRGYAFASLGRFDKAVEDYGEAIRLEPGYGVAYLNRAFAFANLARSEQALQDYQHAVRLNPDWEKQGGKDLRATLGNALLSVLKSQTAVTKQ